MPNIYLKNTDPQPTEATHVAIRGNMKCANAFMRDTKFKFMHVYASKELWRKARLGAIPTYRIDEKTGKVIETF